MMANECDKPTALEKLKSWAEDGENTHDFDGLDAVEIVDEIQASDALLKEALTRS